MLTGGYLIIISVTMAWILLRFLPEWTCWALLALLAFYDLCAVLTPCGPLKWLVGIMQERDEPLPGLLYEAQIRRAPRNGMDGLPSNLPPGTTLVSQMSMDVDEESRAVSNPLHQKSTASANDPLVRSFAQDEHGNIIIHGSAGSRATRSREDEPSSSISEVRITATDAEQNGGGPMTMTRNIVRSNNAASLDGSNLIFDRERDMSSSSPQPPHPRATASSTNIMYRMSTTAVHDEQTSLDRNSESGSIQASKAAAANLMNTYRQGHHPPTPSGNVVVPVDRSESTTGDDDSTALPNERSIRASSLNVMPMHDPYNGTLRPVQGDHQAEFLDFEDDRSIKLGLGDFVFYSLLCARAALVSFTTFIAVFVVVLFGLAMTLVLLAVYRQALPALPISILLGLVFFFAVDAVVYPFVVEFSTQMFFV